jgi:hypothetical protein
MVTKQPKPGQHIVRKAKSVNFDTVMQDAEFHGLNEFRRPTDVIFLVLFLLFVLGNIIIGYSAAPATFFNIFSAYNQHQRLFRPTDFYGRVCGVDNSRVNDGVLSIPDAKECNTQGVTSSACVNLVSSRRLKQDLSKKPFLYYLDITQPFYYGGTCVSYCPGTSGQEYCPPELEPDPLIPNSCVARREDKTFPMSPATKMLTSGLTYRTLLFRCLPNISPSMDISNSTKISTTRGNILSHLNSFSMIFDELWADISRCWKVFVISATVAILLGFGFLVFVRLYAAAFIWFAIGMLFTVLFFGGAFGLYFYSSSPHDDTVLSAWMPNLRFYLSLISIICSFLYLFIIGLSFRRIKRATGIFREAATAVASLPSLLLLPMLLFIIISVFILYWIQIALSLWSSVGSTHVQGKVTQFSWSISHRLMFGYHIFTFFWVGNFVIAYLYTTVAGAIATFYWTPHEEKHVALLKQPVLRSALRCLLFHLGSLACGSLIVGLVQYVSFFVQRIMNKLQSISGNNTIVKIIHGIVKCTLGCVNNIMRHVSKHAYIQIAIFGEDFFTSSRNALALIRRNISQIAVVDTIGDWILFLAQLTISILTTYIASLLVNTQLVVFDIGQDPVELKFSSRLLVLAFVFAIAFFIARVFMIIFETAIDTVLQCYLMDLEISMNSGRPSFSSPHLKALIEENKKSNLEDEDVNLGLPQFME